MNDSSESDDKTRFFGAAMVRLVVKNGSVASDVVRARNFALLAACLMLF